MGNQSVETISVWPFVVVIIILIIALVWLAWQYRKVTRSEIKQKTKELKGGDKIAKLKAQLKENEKTFDKLIPVVERFATLRDGMAVVAEKPTAKERLEALHNLLEKAKVWDKNITDNQGLTLLGKVLNEAESLTEDAEQFMPVVMLLQRKIQQFYGHLRIVDLDEVSERQIRTDFLALSMMMIDVMESISNPNYIEALQGINLKLLKEEITLEEATGLTSPVTFLDVETPVWAQKLFKSIEKWAGSKDEPLIENRPYLLNGLRFEFNNQKQNGL